MRSTRVSDLNEHPFYSTEIPPISANDLVHLAIARLDQDLRTREKVAEGSCPYRTAVESGVTPVLMNKLLRRLRYNIRPSRSIEYTGGNAINLGDQAIFYAVNQTFPGVTVA